MAKKKTTTPTNKAGEPTVKIVVSVAKEMNEIMGLKPPINVTAKKPAIMEQIAANAAEVHANDDFTAATWSYLKDQNLVDHLEKKKAAAKKAAATKKEKGPKFKRTHAVCDALTKKGQTIDELTEKADNIYVEKGGSSNPNQTVKCVHMVVEILLHANVVKEKDGKFSLS